MVNPLRRVLSFGRRLDDRVSVARVDWAAGFDQSPKFQRQQQAGVAFAVVLISLVTMAFAPTALILGIGSAVAVVGLVVGVRLWRHSPLVDEAEWALGAGVLRPRP